MKRIRLVIVLGLVIALAIVGVRAWLWRSALAAVGPARDLVVKDPARALQVAQRAIGWAEVDKSGLELAVLASIRLKATDDGYSYFNRLESVAKPSRVIATTMAEHLISSAWLPEAEAVLRDVLKREEHEEALRLFTTLLLTEGRRWESLPFFERTVRNRSFLLDELVMLGSLTEVLEDEATLKMALRRGVRIELPLVGLGKLEAYGHRDDAAIPYFERAIKANSEFIEAWAGLGLSLVSIEQTEKLLDWRERIPQQALQHPDCQFTLGWLAKAEANLPEAIGHLHKAVMLDPNHRKANYLLGICLASAGTAEEAGKFAERAAQLDKLEILLHRMLLNERDFDVFVEILDLMIALGRPLEADAWCIALNTYHPDAASVSQERQLEVHNRFGTNLPLIAANLNEELAIDAASISNLNVAVDSPVLPKRLDADKLGFHFEDLAEELGLNVPYFGGLEGEPRQLWIYQGFGGGVGVLDFDQDGTADLYFVQGNTYPPGDDPRGMNMLYRQQGQQFELVSEKSGTEGSGYGQGVAVGDLDADGFDDLYVACIGENRLFRNNGDGTFTDVTRQVLPSQSEWTTSCLLADVSGDGLDDIYDVNYAAGQKPFTEKCYNNENGEFRTCKPDLFEPATDRLLISQGDGMMKDVSGISGIVSSLGRGMGIVAADLDQNATVDLFVSNDMTPNELYLNEGRSPEGIPLLSEQALLRGVAYNGEGRVEACMGISFGDVTGDGQFDLFVTNFYDETNTLYVQEREGFFQDKTIETGAAEGSRKILSFGTQFLDADLDADDDLVVVNGHVDDYRHIDIPWKMRPSVHLNSGRRFQLDSSRALGDYSERETLGRALAKLDWNRDGRPDFVVTHLDRAPALLSNMTEPAGHAISFKLVGTSSNRSGVGTTLKLHLGERTLVLHQSAGDGYYCSNERKLIAGLGQETVVPRLEVQWPSGLKQEFLNLQSGHNYVVVEKSDDLLATPHER